jgi:hypothetical protein
MDLSSVRREPVSCRIRRQLARGLEYLQASTEKISTFVQFHVFMEATSDDQDFTEFRDTLLTEAYQTISMPNVIARFLSHFADC